MSNLEFERSIIQVARRDDKKKTRDPWGLCVHTTGGGVTAKAAKSGKKPIDIALAAYRASQGETGKMGAHGYAWGGPTYVLDIGGQIYQIADDSTLTAHCGNLLNRQAYKSDKWVEMCSPRTVAQWHSRWSPRYKNPAMLFPSTSPNTDYIGLEMIPCPGFDEAMRPGLRFTRAQHEAVISLGLLLAERHQWPERWEQGSRLIGHEDVQPLDRSDKLGGWDPGFLRADPYFALDYVRAGVSVRSGQAPATS